MNDLEKKIEEAAKKSSMDYDSRDYTYDIAKQEFIIGAKSPEAKEYWQQGMYTEEEVTTLINRLLEFIAHHEPSEWKKWLDQNKKKS